MPIAFLALLSKSKALLFAVDVDKTLVFTEGTKASVDGANVAHDAAVTTSKANAAERDCGKISMLSFFIFRYQIK